MAKKPKKEDSLTVEGEATPTNPEAQNLNMQDFLHSKV